MEYKEVDLLIKEGQSGRYKVFPGFYLRIARGKPSWMLRYTIGGKRKDYTLSIQYPTTANHKRKTAAIGLAIAQATQLQAQIADGIDPAIEKQEQNQVTIYDCNDLFSDWFNSVLMKRLKHPNIPKRYFNNEISPHIGKKAVGKVTPQDVRRVIQKVVDTDRPSVANKTLDTIKNLFDHGIKLGLIVHNPAATFTYADAAGVQPGRCRALSLKEIRAVFKVLRNNRDAVTRQNYLAYGLLLLLGVRKEELTTARWSDFNLSRKTWSLTADSVKTTVPITIPLSGQAVEWLKELRILACGSAYVFPNRRKSKSPHISHDTLNHCLAKLFGKKASFRQPSENVMGKAGIDHFTVHDLRRTFRTLLAGLGVAPHIAERCLNHKLRGVEGIYDRHDYFPERKEALEKLARHVVPAINDEDNVVPITKEATL